MIDKIKKALNNIKEHIEDILLNIFDPMRHPERMIIAVYVLPFVILLIMYIVLKIFNLPIPIAMKPGGLYYARCQCS